MTLKNKKDFWLAVGLLSGTIIGAGVFALPSVFQISGLAVGFFYLALGSVAYSVIHWMYADVILKTEGEHRFVGYAGIYLGKFGFWLSIAMTIVEMILVMTIYLILSQSFGNLLGIGISGPETMLVFWFLGSMAIFFSLRRIAFLELVVSAGIVLIIFLIFGFGLVGFPAALINFTPNFNALLLPLAPILFALSGRVAIPAVVSFFKGKPHPQSLIKKSIIWGTVIPAVAYGLFVVGILGLTPIPTEDSVSGLIGNAPVWVLMAVGVLGLISLWSSYIVVGLDIRNSLVYDLKFPKFLTFIAVVAIPLLIYFAGFQSFLGLVSFVGGVFLALEGIFIVLMWIKANKIRHPHWWLVPLILIFAVALVYAIIG